MQQYPASTELRLASTSAIVTPKGLIIIVIVVLVLVRAMAWCRWRAFATVAPLS